MILTFERCNLAYPGVLCASSGECAIINVQGFSYFGASLRVLSGTPSAFNVEMLRSFYWYVGYNTLSYVPSIVLDASTLGMDDYVGVSAPLLVPSVTVPEGSDLFVDLVVELRE